MKTIEELFAEKRTTTDQIDLPIDHRERMQARLNSAATQGAPQGAPQRKVNSRKLLVVAIGAAAAVVALCLIVIPVPTSTSIPTPETANPITAKITTVDTPTSPIADTTVTVQITQTAPKSILKVKRAKRVTPPTVQLSAAEIEAAEVEKHFTAKRDEAIEEVKRLLDDKDPAVAAQIRSDLEQLSSAFKTDSLPKSLLLSNPDQYLSLTMNRLVAQREIVDRVKYSVLHFTQTNAPHEPILN